MEQLRAALTLIPARTALLPVERSGHDLARAAAIFPEIQAHLRALAPAP